MILVVIIWRILRKRRRCTFIHTFEFQFNLKLTRIQADFKLYSEGEGVVHQPGLVVQRTWVKIAKWLTLRNFGCLLLTMQHLESGWRDQGNTSVLKMHISIILSLCTIVCECWFFPIIGRNTWNVYFLKALYMVILHSRRLQQIVDILYIYCLQFNKSLPANCGWFLYIFLSGT